jgi:hypothetical protein
MKLLVKYVDMRGGYQEGQAWRTDVVDEETGKIVGWVHAERSPAFRTISLFGGKYETTFSSSDSISECNAFARGVEAVLNHMVAISEEVAKASEPP